MVALASGRASETQVGREGIVRSEAKGKEREAWRAGSSTFASSPSNTDGPSPHPAQVSAGRLP